MNATILDLRYRMRDVLRALDRNEDVTVLYRNRPKGVLKARRAAGGLRVKDHPFFGMRKDRRPVEDVMTDLRGGRYRAV